MTVKIKDKEYKFQFDSVWGGLYTYEDLFGKKIPFDPTRIFCIHLMLYCILLRCNGENAPDIDTFLNALNDLQLESDLRSYYMSRTEELSRGAEADATEEVKKKD